MRNLTDLAQRPGRWLPHPMRFRVLQAIAATEKIVRQVTGVQGDVANLADRDRLDATVQQQTGLIDVLFANAGLGEFVPLGQITEAHFDKTFGINVKGILFTVQRALPLMPDGASIVINGSMTSIKGTPVFGVYAATKAALRSFARTWSVDLKNRKIRVNVTSLGTVITPGYTNELVCQSIGWEALGDRRRQVGDRLPHAGGLRSGGAVLTGASHGPDISRAFRETRWPGQRVNCPGSPIGARHL